MSGWNHQLDYNIWIRTISIITIVTIIAIITIITIIAIITIITIIITRYDWKKNTEKQEDPEKSADNKSTTPIWAWLNLVTWDERTGDELQDGENLCDVNVGL